MVPAVVFDFDGVIARSMETHAEAYRRILSPFGVAVADRDVFLREGARSESILRDLLTAAGRDPDGYDVATLADRKQALFQELATPTLYPGAADVVRATQAVTATGLVTGTRRENLECLIPDLLPGFTAVLAQDAYRHDKPHPEPYQRAAAALGRDPADCIAVENAVRGVQSAQAAGYNAVIAITTTLSAQDLADAGPDAIVTDHEALGQELRTRLGQQP